MPLLVNGPVSSIFCLPTWPYRSSTVESSSLVAQQCMRKIKEVLRLRFDLGLQRQITRSCAIGLSTVHDYLERAAAARISWPLPEGLSEEELEAKLFESTPVSVRAVPTRAQPDWEAIHEQLQQHRHLTLQLLWQEYRQTLPDGYRYSWFCERYQQWRRRLDVVLRQEHKAGEKMFVDWAGAAIPVYDATTGEAWPASLFVAVLGASSYTYAEATRDQQWHVNCYVNQREIVALRTAIYTRVSTTKQECDNQLLQLRDFAAKQE